MGRASRAGFFASLSVFALVLCVSWILLTDALATSSRLPLDEILSAAPQKTADLQSEPENQEPSTAIPIPKLGDWAPREGWGHLQKGFHPDVVPAEKCRAYSCFNFSKCPGPSLKIYTYPHLRNGPFRSLMGPFLSYINVSGLETVNPEEACIFIPPFDVACNHIEEKDENMLTKLRELPFWNNGRNHLIYYNNDEEPIVCYGFLDQAMYVSTTQSLTDFRIGYDISIPIFSELTRNIWLHYNRNAAIRHPAERKLLVTFKGSIYQSQGTIRRNLLALAKAYAAHPRIQLFFNCKFPFEERSINCGRLQRSFDSSPDFKNLLADSVFGLCPEGFGHHSFRLLESMMFGAIPVVLSDEYVLPFVPEVNWAECVIHYPEHLVLDMFSRLSEMPPAAVRKRQLKCLELFEKYFVDNVDPANPARADGERNAFHHVFNFLAARSIPHTAARDF